MPVLAWLWDEIGEPVQELKRRQLDDATRARPPRDAAGGRDFQWFGKVLDNEGRKGGRLPWARVGPRCLESWKDFNPKGTES